MNQPNPPSNRRAFLRSAGALGLLALGAEPALGRSLLARQDGDGGGGDATECTLHTMTRSRSESSTLAAGTKSESFTWGGTETGTYTRTDSFTLRTITATETALGGGGVVWTISSVETLSADPGLANTQTFSVMTDKNGKTLVRTQSLSKSTSFTYSSIQTLSCWQHADDCDGNHGSDQNGGMPSDPRHAAGPEPLAPPPSVLDPRTRFEVFAFPVLN